ncbi:leucine rich adaptor protein 1 [Tachyglossus aculeatus]|uniref:leucine rich adaptor protein 1 n=1 Tax=Tachyglossus aculeatus TaxID=9261 RepID=UPI0018F52DBB|nr:leucine rich adaptor protein 1 [Tachyglossus aculeatus]
MEGPAEPAAPDLRDVESKVGRKMPEGLLRGLREAEPTALPLRSCGETRGLGGGPAAAPSPALGDKINALKLELAYLRATDVKILQQLLAVNEGIEAVRWLLEEKGTLTSHCSSLASSQYSLSGSQEASRRGSWDSAQDPTDRLDSVSIGSYLDTLASEPDDERAQEPLLSSTPCRPGPPLSSSLSPPRAELDWAPFGRGPRAEPEKAEPTRLRTSPVGPVRVGHRGPGLEVAGEAPRGEKARRGEPEHGRVRLGFDAHLYWVQSQDDVTFL